MGGWRDRFLKTENRKLKTEQRIRLLIQFDGTDFCGWAEQPKFRTVQGTLKNCIRRISGEDVELTGSSRTDSGAHAAGMAADFVTANPMPPEKWAPTMNRLLEKDIRTLRSGRTFMAFNSRFYARSRTYEYRIAEVSSVEPWRARYVYEGTRKLDFEAMHRAAESLKGKHDFRAFGEELGNLENAVRDVMSVTVRRVRDEIRIRVEATAFIRGMMRRIAGGLYEVGRGKRSIDDFEALLDKKKRDKVFGPVVLPARGLTLVSVKYGRSLRDLRDE